MEQFEPLITVIVPIYNGQEYLERCVSSILNQSYQKLELLLIDGGSTDRTAELCRSLAQKQDRIRFLQEENNRGVSFSRNHGLREAAGEYISFVDADDWLMPDCLERLMTDLVQTGAQIAGCAFRSCSKEDVQQIQEKQGKLPEQKRVSQGERLVCDRSVISGDEFLREGILKGDTRCWSKLYSAESIRGCFFREDYTIGEDMLFLRDAAMGAEKISSSSYEGYCYYRNPAGAMQKPFRRSDMDQIRCWQEILEQTRQEQMPQEVVSRAASILLISCMLVAGKLAVLGKERAVFREEQEVCREVLKKTLRIHGAYSELTAGYRIKVLLYRCAPALYLRLYGMRKRK